MIPDTMNEERLWLLVREEDSQPAFDRVYYLHVNPIFALIYKHIKSRQDAEDLTQEVFLDLWQKRKEIIIQSSLFNYLYSMARYKTLRYLKVNAIKPESFDLLAGNLEQMNPSLPGTYTEKEILAIESSVNEEIALLPAQMKKVYQLNTEAGMSIREIADQLMISPYTVKNHLAKVRSRLRQTVSRLASLFFSLL
jgi:RNA polymerase sigma-70 factor (ECF subfamily)